MDFGTPVTDSLKSGTSFVDINLIKEDFFWAGFNQAIAFGSKANSWGYAEADYPTVVSNSLYSVIDTGSSALMISALYYNSLVNEMMRDVP